MYVTAKTIRLSNREITERQLLLFHAVAPIKSKQRVRNV